MRESKGARSKNGATTIRPIRRPAVESAVRPRLDDVASAPNEGRRSPVVHTPLTGLGYIDRVPINERRRIRRAPD
jgi:hypothetical protein